MMALFGAILVQAQNAEYYPLMREGVKWHYNLVHAYEGYIDNGFIYFDGDSVVNGITYKKCMRSGASNGSPHVGALMRESGKIVYSIGGMSLAYDNYSGRPGEYDGEMILYDFNDPITMFPDYLKESFTETTADVDGVAHKCYLVRDYSETQIIIEGIGLDGWGYLYGHIFQAMTGIIEGTQLSYVEENGRIIYKGSAYNNEVPVGQSDLNGDGKVDISDINEAINVMLGKSAAAADVNGDGACDIADVNAVINVMLGKQ